MNKTVDEFCISSNIYGALSLQWLTSLYDNNKTKVYVPFNCSCRVKNVFFNEGIVQQHELFIQLKKICVCSYEKSRFYTKSLSGSIEYYNTSTNWSSPLYFI